MNYKVLIITIMAISFLIFANPTFAKKVKNNPEGGFIDITPQNNLLNENANIGTISGTVTDSSSGSVISGATVSIDSNSTITDDTGSYIISVISSPNPYTMTANASGYQSSTVKVKVPVGNITQDFHLVPLPVNGTITGTVTNASSGTGIAGATVKADGVSTTTDTSGSYTISISPGKYTVIASSPGYQSSSTSITVTDGATIPQDFQLIPMPIPKIISITPTSPIVVQSPSTVIFTIVTDQVADEIWQLDNSTVQKNLSVTGSSFTSTNYVGRHKVTVEVTDQNGANSYSWDWTIMGQLSINVDNSLIYTGTPTNVTFNITRACGIEAGDNCSNISFLPVVGAKVSLNSSGNMTTGSNITNMTTDSNGQAMFTIDALDSGHIRATATKYLYNDSFVIVNAGIPAPTTGGGSSGGGSSGGGSSGGSSSSSSGSGGGGGGGGVSTGEPYDNIINFESQENFISLTPVAFRYSTNNFGVYEVDIIGNQSDDVTLRVELLKGTSKLVGFSAPGIVYKNINMWINSKRIANATIKYKVENSWMDSNNISADNVNMLRWNNDTAKWENLPTTAVNKDGTYTYFESATSKFSSFAIGSNSQNLNSVPNIPNNTVEEKGNIFSTPVSEPTVVLDKKRGSTIFEAIIAAITIVLAVYLFRMKKEIK